MTSYFLAYGCPRSRSDLARHRNAVRRLLAHRTYRCHRSCKGWDIFEAHHIDSLVSNLEVERCDDCAINNDWSPYGFGAADVAMLQDAQWQLRVSLRKEIAHGTSTDRFEAQLSEIEA